MTSYPPKAEFIKLPKADAHIRMPTKDTSSQLREEVPAQLTAAKGPQRAAPASWPRAGTSLLMTWVLADLSVTEGLILSSPQYFNFPSGTLLLQCPNARVNIIFNGKQDVTPSKQADTGLLLPWKRAIGCWQNKRLLALVLTYEGEETASPHTYWLGSDLKPLASDERKDRSRWAW